MENTTFLFAGIGVSLLILIFMFLRMRKITCELSELQKSLNREFKKVNHYLAVLTKNEGEELTNDFKIYVGNVDYSASEEELQSFFEQCGQVAEVNIPRDRRSNRPRGYGFITYSEPNNAAKALELDGSSFKGRTIQVNFAK